MAHQALYREWRPIVFDDVVEQKHAVYALRQAVISGQVAHAYLFSGTRGTGKTSLAKIFARAINCLDPQQGNPCNQCTICRGMLDGSLLDIVEMDAASNNSVDNIRRICDEVVFMPAQAKYKVYIIDEVHMLSTGAFNALLKTLEEPPAHAVFILATTEPHRLPATILSRCQRYEFRRIPVESIIVRLRQIAEADKIQASDDALLAMASLSDGAMRDAISLLDQARASFPETISRDDVLSLAGIVQDDFMLSIAQALLEGNVSHLLELVEQLVMNGRDLAHFVTDLAQHFRNILVCQVTDNPQMLVRASSEALGNMQQLASGVSGNDLVELIKGLSTLLSEMRWASDARTTLEIGLIRLMKQDAQLAAKPKPKSTAPVMAATKPDQQESVPVSDSTPAETPTPQTVAKDSTEPEEAPEASHEEAPADLDAPFTDEDPGPEPPPEESDEDSADMTPSAPVAEPTAIAGSQTAPPVEKAAAETSAPAAFNAETLWKATLDQLMSSGQMTLYLFSRSATPMLEGSTLKLLFAGSDQIHFQEVSQKQSIRLLTEIATAAAGHKVNVLPVLDGDNSDQPKDANQSDQPGWIQKIKQTADQMNIPVKMEE